MKKLVSLMVVGLLFAAGVSAQFESNAVTYYEEDHKYNKRAVKQREVVEPCFIREADVKYLRRIHRIIDVRQKLNHCLTWKKNPFAEVLWQNVVNGNLRPYKTDDLSDTAFYTVEEVIKNVSGTEIVEVIDDSLSTPEEPVFKVVEIPRQFYSDEFKRFRIMEDWIFDYQRSVFEPRIIAIAPYFKAWLAGGERDINEYPAFWIDMDAFRHILVNSELFNRQNDAARLTYDDFFQMRLFDSYVIEESNEWDWDINQFPEFKDNGVDALLEAERVKNDLFIFEHDLWEY